MKLIPATVESWDGVTLRVFIDGYTDGADVGMRAEVLYPLADRPDYTGFDIRNGDAVWVFFNGGDVNSPIVMGFRNQNTGQNKDIRRMRHKHYEAHCDENMTMTAGSSLTLTSGNIVLKGDVIVNGSITSTKDIKADTVSLQNHTHAGGPVPDK